jgi:hypothetical protein
MEPSRFALSGLVVASVVLELMYYLRVVRKIFWPSVLFQKLIINSMTTMTVLRQSRVLEGGASWRCRMCSYKWLASRSLTSYMT